MTPPPRAGLPANVASEAHGAVSGPAGPPVVDSPAAAMSSGARVRAVGRSKRVRLVLGLASFSLLLLFSSPQQILSLLVHVDRTWLALSFALCLLVMVIRTYRWWGLLHDFGLRAPFHVLLEMMTVSGFFNLFLPGSVGGDAYRAYGLARYSAKTLRPVASVVIERFTGVIALFLICPVAVWFARAELPVPPWTLYVACGAVLAAALGLLVAGLHAESWWGVLAPRLPRIISRRLPGEKMQIVFSVLRDLRGRPGAFARACLTGVVLQVVVLFAYYTMAVSLHGHIHLPLFFSFFPLIEFVSLIPLTVNGLGVREGLTVYFLGAAGIPASFSMGLSIINRLITLALGALGGVVFVARRTRRRTSGVRSGD
jgi:uncharacterized membrane protein YbhN (UPF0104 family)